jgi:pimeloyl-ACP methyl ester carboxylesterase
MKFKIILKIFIRTFLTFLMLIFLIIILSFRRDVSKESMEKTYFTDQSNYITLTIDTLDESLVTIDVHYIDYGDLNDPVIVLLHGAFSSSHTFLPWMDELVQLGYRIIAIDLPNHGLTGGFSDNIISQRRSAAIVKAILDHLFINECIIGGNSMGGGVAWEFASEYHQMSGFTVNGLILIDAVFPSMESSRPAESALFKSSFVSNFVSKFTPKVLMKIILKGVYGSNSSIDPVILDRYYDLLRVEGHRSSLLSSVEEVKAENSLSGEARLTKIKEANIPILIMWGEEDRWISVDYAFSFQTALSLDDHDMIIYEGIGHVPMEENPNLTLVDLLSFLNNIET